MLACFTLFSTKKPMSIMYLREIVTVVGKDLATRIKRSSVSVRAEHGSVLFTVISHGA